MANVFRNSWESFTDFLINKLSKNKEIYLTQRRKEVQEMITALEYRKADIIYLFEKGFKYDKEKDIFFKVENFNYGAYPGKYEISISFPNNYPKKHPTIKAVPLHKNKISIHLRRSTGNLCVSAEKHGYPDTYWEEHMNARGALLLSYQLITGVLEGKKSRIKLKGTIFEDLLRLTTKEKFIDNFKHLKIMNDVDKKYTWGEIAYVWSQGSTTHKQKLINYYNKLKEKKNEKNKSKTTKRKSF